MGELFSIQHIDNPYRLKYPMKRVGLKGEGKWKCISWLRSFMAYPQCQIHPKTSAQCGLTDGDWIWIEIAHGKIRQKLRAFME